MENIIHIVLLLLTAISVNCSSKQKLQYGKNIQLQAPHLASQYQDVRPPIQSSASQAKLKMKAPVLKRVNSTFPCNGSRIKTNGTTCGLKEIMIGRCYDYQYNKRRGTLSLDTDIKNCTEIYTAFESAVRYKSYCDANMKTYERYFITALSGVQVINKAMFWSGTYAVTHAYSASGVNYITLEDTLAAAMVNGLVWCGKANDTDGFDFISCPNNCKDNKWADFAFWGLASKTFAELASGEIYVVLNGSQSENRAAFRNDSYFAQFELSNLRRTGTNRVTKVNVLILHSPDQLVVEKCGERSLLVLEKLVLEQGFEFDCRDDPEELILIMCGDQWDARECQIARNVLRHAWDIKLYGTSSSNEAKLQQYVWLCVTLLWSMYY